jgi:hypothetical protein
MRYSIHVELGCELFHLCMLYIRMQWFLFFSQFLGFSSFPECLRTETDSKGFLQALYHSATVHISANRDVGYRISDKTLFRYPI